MGCRLAIDTVSARPAIAIDCNGRVHTHALTVGRKQSQTLLTELERCMNDAGIGYSDVTELAVLTGPGSFTGVRVGLSFLKGLSIALDIPLYGENHFKVLEQILPEDGYGILILESGRDEKFIHFCHNGKLLEEPINMDIDDLLAQHSGTFEKCKYMFSDCDVVISTNLEDIADGSYPAVLLLSGYPKDTSESINPFYMRQADTTISNKKN